MRKENAYGKWIAVGGAALAAVLIGVNVRSSLAYPTYNAGCNNPACHGDFDGPTSPKGTVFPSDSKHEMHRGTQNMNTDCMLCHFQQPGDKPFTGVSGGTANNPGVGCTGCHGRDYGGALGDSGVGLRLHHFMNNVPECIGCHGFGPDPLPESVSPTYYGTVDTNADDPCNLAPGFGESWSIGDGDGLDNDGDNQYDANDADCGGCPWDCQGEPDGQVNISDFLAILAQWGEKGTSCDFGSGDVGVGINEFLDFLAHFGPCP
jgi:hypothetical protein